MTQVSHPAPARGETDDHPLATTGTHVGNADDDVRLPPVDGTRVDHAYVLINHNTWIGGSVAISPQAGASSGGMQVCLGIGGSGYSGRFSPTTVGGSMTAVIRNTSQLDPEDRNAMAAYIKALAPVEGPKKPEKAEKK